MWLIKEKQVFWLHKAVVNQGKTSFIYNENKFFSFTKLWLTRLLRRQLRELGGKMTHFWFNEGDLDYFGSMRL